MTGFQIAITLKKTFMCYKNITKRATVQDLSKIPDTFKSENNFN